MLSPDIGVSEMLIVAAVALIVVGPKDLPLLLRRVGQFIAKLRSMASEFRASFDDMARQSELEELRKEVEAMRSGQLTGTLKDAVGGAGDPSVDQVFADIESGMKSGEVSFAPPMAYSPVAEPEAEPAPKPARRSRAKAAPAEPSEASPPAKSRRKPAKAKAAPEAEIVDAPKRRRAKTGIVT